MLKLDNIGFYTLREDRVKQAGKESPLWRCELILTDKCNFRCTYCKGIREELKGDIELRLAKEVIDMWSTEGLRNIRFSGGEPTLYPYLEDLVKYAKYKGIERVALSTNGSVSLDYYKKLIKLGVDDFSISLDACCVDFGNKMAGVEGVWEKVVRNIEELAKYVYVTVGIVINEDNIEEIEGIIELADSLGVSDIRVITAAQYNKLWNKDYIVESEKLNKYPILRYRIENIRGGRDVRGLKETDSRRCYLVLDDMAVAGKYHFPCIIYLREGGDYIGRIDNNLVREDRYKWFINHNSWKDYICRYNCLDVCIDYNNKYERYKIEKESIIPRISSMEFDFSKWREGSIHEFFIPCRYEEVTKGNNREFLRYKAVGWNFSELIPCRPKVNHIAVMFYNKERHFWFHLRSNEFVEIFC